MGPNKRKSAPWFTYRLPSRYFFRFFALPAVNHCGTGFGGAEADTGGDYTQMARHPLDPSSYDRTRPVYAYPDVAKYKGTGDSNRAENWEKAPR